MSCLQESETLNHLRMKLGDAEQKILHLETTNRILTEMSTQTEEKHAHALKQME